MIDVQETIYKPKAFGQPITMQLVHTPTGIRVQAKGFSHYKLKQQLTTELEHKVGLIP